MRKVKAKCHHERRRPLPKVYHKDVYDIFTSPKDPHNLVRASAALSEKNREELFFFVLFFKAELRKFRKSMNGERREPF